MALRILIRAQLSLLAFAGLVTSPSRAATLGEIPDVVFHGSFETAICGNALVEEQERCDDGGTASGDGCNAQCDVEDGYYCHDNPSVCDIDCTFAFVYQPPFGRVSPVAWTPLTGAPTFPGMAAAQSTVPHRTDPDAVYVGARRGYFLSVRFTVADDFTGKAKLSWSPSKLPGTTAQRIPNLGAPVTISGCPGDFRIDIDRPTFSADFQGCKSIHVASDGTTTARTSLQVNGTGVSTDSVCGLRPGHTYYLNYTNANPLPSDGGITPDEWTCPNDAESCGIELTVH